MVRARGFEPPPLVFETGAQLTVDGSVEEHIGGEIDHKLEPVRFFNRDITPRGTGGYQSSS
jgi:hypothetical protein